jgi:murein DD-endopeptidase MepM/ murein hydrolase activator NlpD
MLHRIPDTLHPVIHFPEENPPPVVDLTTTYDREQLRTMTWAIGRYNEVRTQAMYSAPQYDAARRVHMGIDIWAPAGTPVHACAQGVIADCVYHDEPGNYGGTVITRHDTLADAPLWILHGHLARQSTVQHTPGDAIEAGAVIGTLGEMHENGGWVPHLHIQLAWHAPKQADYPGVVRLDERAAAVQRYPDPRWVLGPVYGRKNSASSRNYPASGKPS